MSGNKTYNKASYKFKKLALLTLLGAGSFILAGCEKEYIQTPEQIKQEQVKKQEKVVRIAIEDAKSKPLNLTAFINDSFVLEGDIRNPKNFADSLRNSVPYVKRLRAKDLTVNAESLDNYTKQGDIYLALVEELKQLQK